jgi:hypothetical protein
MPPNRNRGPVAIKTLGCAHKGPSQATGSHPTFALSAQPHTTHCCCWAFSSAWAGGSGTCSHAGGRQCRSSRTLLLKLIRCTTCSLASASATDCNAPSTSPSRLACSGIGRSSRFWTWRSIEEAPAARLFVGKCNEAPQLSHERTLLTPLSLSFRRVVASAIGAVSLTLGAATLSTVQAADRPATHRRRSAGQSGCARDGGEGRIGAPTGRSTDG